MLVPIVTARLHLEEIFDEDETGFIWAALHFYNVGPKEENPKLWAELEARRKTLLEAFE